MHRPHSTQAFRLTRRLTVPPPKLGSLVRRASTSQRCHQGRSPPRKKPLTRLPSSHHWPVQGCGIFFLKYPCSLYFLVLLSQVRQYQPSNVARELKQKLEVARGGEAVSNDFVLGQEPQGGVSKEPDVKPSTASRLHFSYFCMTNHPLLLEKFRKYPAFRFPFLQRVTNSLERRPKSKTEANISKSWGIKDCLQCGSPMWRRKY